MNISGEEIVDLLGDFTDNFLVKIDDKDILTNFTNAVFNDDLFGVIPFGKLINFGFKKILEIADQNKAFRVAFNASYCLTFLRACQRYKIELKIQKQTKEELKKINGEFLVESFDMYNFNTNTIISQYEELLFVNIGELYKNKVKKYISDYLKLNFISLIEDSKLKLKKLNEYFKSDKYEEQKRLSKYQKYDTELKNMYFHPVFDDIRGVGLNDLYIEPNFGIYEHCFDKEYSNKEDIFIDVKTYEESIHNYIYDVIKKNEPIRGLKQNTHNVVFLLGSPGQGKSSFCKRFLYDAIEDSIFGDKKVFYIRLKEINVSDLTGNPIKTIKEKIEKEIDLSLGNEFENAILLLDGLDEVHIQNNLAIDEIDEICKNIIHRANNYYKNIKIIITSRKGYISLEKFKKEENLLILQLKDFSIEMQIQWLEKYKKFYKDIKLSEEKIKLYNDEDGKYSHIKELITQPILLYMIATIDFDVDNGANKAAIYDKLFTMLIQRKYDSKQIKILENIEKDDLRDFIRDIAFNIFVTKKDSIHKKEMLKLDCTKKFIQKIGEKSVNDSIKGVMIAFYFQETKSKDEEASCDYAIEFIHKSLYEYMCAEKIWYEILGFIDRTERTKKYRIDSLKDCLEKLSNLFSRRFLTNEVSQYLIEIIQNDKNTDKNKLSDRLSLFLEQLLQKDFLYSYNIDGDDNPIDMSINTFYGYWLVLSSLELKKNYITNESIKERFVLLLKILLNYKSGLNLSYQDLSCIRLRGADLRGADLRGADLRGAYLNGAYLIGAYLIGAYLIGAYLIGAYLRGAYLRGADLRGADLRGAYLIGADLNGAYLIGAYLIGADLRGAYLNGADLNGADLREADLRGADLNGADLNGADLREADLREADLREADLREAKNLTRKQLLSARLYNTKIDKENYRRLTKDGEIEGLICGDE